MKNPRHIILGLGCNPNCKFAGVMTTALVKHEAVVLAEIAMGGTKVIYGGDMPFTEETLPDNGYRVPLHIVNPDALNKREKNKLGSLAAFNLVCSQSEVNISGPTEACKGCPYTDPLSDFAGEIAMKNLGARELPPPQIG